MIEYSCKPFYKLSHDELYAIMVLRQEVFVVEQKCTYVDADNLDQKGHHLMGFDETKRLVAYARILPTATRYPAYPSIGRVITAKPIRGTGIGRELMEEGIERLYDVYGVSPIKISAQTQLKEFYESLGFSPVGKKYREDGMWHIGMVKS